MTYIVWRLLCGYIECDIYSLLLAIFFGVLIDGDAVVLGSRHRMSMLHSLVLWLPTIPILYMLGVDYYWTPLFAIIHIAMDSLDWGVYAFYPFSNRIFGLRYMSRRSLLNPGKNRINEFAREYLSSKLFAFLEAIVISSALLLLFFDITG